MFFMVISLSDEPKKIKSVKNETLLSKKRKMLEIIEEPKRRSESVIKKPKIKTGIEYIKGKYNTRIQLIEKCKTLEGKGNEVNNSCCVVCSNRNCIRAAKTKNYILMKNCIADTKHISSLINPYSVGMGNAIEIAIKNNDKKIIEMIFNSWNKPRCFKEMPKIKLVDTGENSEYMVGVRVRKLNQTRGNRMGNDAFIRDDVEINRNEIVNLICETITEKVKDPQFIDFFKSLKYNNNNNKNVNNDNNDNDNNSNSSFDNNNNNNQSNYNYNYNY